jgi:hypothetical protein
LQAAELVGRAVVMTDGKAGTIERVCIDDLHGLRRSAGDRVRRPEGLALVRLRDSGHRP